MNSPRPDILDDILARLSKKGKAKYNFGTFYLFKRGGHKITLRSGRRKTVKPYIAVFFRGSNILRLSVNKIK